MNRAGLLLTLACLLLPAACGDGRPTREWAAFKAAFMSDDGRVIDWQNEQRSHSEGQGYAMVLAVFMDDRPAFDRAFAWSENNLGRGLRAWSWGRNGTTWGILSANNATDGDMLHAWALLLAGESRRDDKLLRAGNDLLAQVRDRLIQADGIILPGREGFIDAAGVITVNPAYYIFPALRDFRRFDPEHAEIWESVYRRGLELVRESADKRTGLVPDWVRCDARGVPLPARDDDCFGYEAVRVPLYLALSGEREALEPIRPLIRRTAREGFLPERLRLDGTAASTGEASAGSYAVLARAAAVLGMDDEAGALWKIAVRRKSAQEDNYYGTVLFLFSLLDRPAAGDSRPGGG